MIAPSFRHKINKDELIVSGGVDKADLGLVNGGKKFKTVEAAMNFCDKYFDEKRLRADAEKRASTISVVSKKEQRRFILGCVPLATDPVSRIILTMMAKGARRDVMAMTLNVTMMRFVELEQRAIDIVKNALAKRQYGNPAAEAL